MKDTILILAVNNYFELTTVVNQRDLLKNNIHIYTEPQENKSKYSQEGFSTYLCDFNTPENIKSSMQKTMMTSKSSIALLNIINLNLTTNLNELTPTKWNELVLTNLTLPFLLMKEFVTAKKPDKVCHIFNIACVNFDFKLNSFSNMFYNSLRSLTYCTKEEIRDLNISVTFLQSNLVLGKVNFNEIFDSVEFCLSNSNRCTIDQVLLN